MNLPAMQSNYIDYWFMFAQDMANLSGHVYFSAMIRSDHFNSYKTKAAPGFYFNFFFKFSL